MIGRVNLVRPRRPGVFFFLDALSRLSLWMTTHLRMRHTTPSMYLDLWEVVVNMIKQNYCQEDCSCKKSYSSGDFKQQQTSPYNYNVLSMNCEQDWKVSGHCSISVVSSRYASYSLFQLVRHSSDLETPTECCPRNGQQLELSAFT